MPDQYQREIEDILKKAEAQVPLPKPQSSRQSLRSLVWRYARQSMSSSDWPISPGKLMLTAVALLLVAAVLRAMLPMVFGPLAWAALVVFIIAYAMFFIKPSKRASGDARSTRKMWRGNYIDDEPESAADSLKDKVRRIFRR